jgi:hypothetical protein
MRNPELGQTVQISLLRTILAKVVPKMWNFYLRIGDSITMYCEKPQLIKTQITTKLAEQHHLYAICWFRLLTLLCTRTKQIEMWIIFQLLHLYSFYVISIHVEHQYRNQGRLLWHYQTLLNMVETSFKHGVLLWKMSKHQKKFLRPICTTLL